MRVALFIIILYLGTIISEFKLMPDFWNGILTGIGWIGLLNNYFKSRKRDKKWYGNKFFKP